MLSGWLNVTFDPPPSISDIKIFQRREGELERWRDKSKPFFGFKTLKTLLTLVLLEILASRLKAPTSGGGYYLILIFLSNSPSQHLSVKAFNFPGISTNSKPENRPSEKLPGPITAKNN